MSSPEASNTRPDHTYDTAPMYYDEALPEGWSRTVVQRQLGKSAGKYDVYIRSPDGKKFRSKTELERYVAEVGLDVNPEDIDFSVRGKKNTANTTPARKQKNDSVKTSKSPSSKLVVSHPAFSKPKKDSSLTKGLKQLKKSPNKTLSQKLVVKMAFGPGKVKIDHSKRTLKKSTRQINCLKLLELNHHLQYLCRRSSRNSVKMVAVKSVRNQWMYM